MTDETTDSETEQTTPTESSSTIWFLGRTALITALFGLIAVEPVAAQNNAVCNADKLPSMIEGFFQLTTALGIVGLAIVWQADSLIEMFTLNPEQKKGLKRHKRSAMKSAVILLVLGPLYTVAGSMMGLPLAQCIDLVPW